MAGLLGQLRHRQKIRLGFAANISQSAIHLLGISDGLLRDGIVEPLPAQSALLIQKALDGILRRHIRRRHGLRPDIYGNGHEADRQYDTKTNPHLFHKTPI